MFFGGTSFAGAPFGDSGFNPNAFVSVSGSRINESTGTVGLVGNANISVTGNRLNFTIGNVTIIEGDWYNKWSELSTYDGIFYDAYGDDNMYGLQHIIPSLIKKGGIFTWWNINKDNLQDIKTILYLAVNLFFHTKKAFLL